MSTAANVAPPGDRLGSGLTGRVTRPSDPDWDRARQAWNLAANQRPDLVVHAATAEDVVEVLRHAARSGRRVAPQGTGHTDSVVEEILRAPAKNNGGIPRYAHADIEIDSTTIRAGDLVLLDVGSANHDPNVFAEPERFDVTRAGPSHLTFGHGARYCLGAPLARIELRVVITGLMRRFQTMRLAIELEDLETRTPQLTGGLAQLPVTWD